MSEPILDTDYWKKRLAEARSGHLHHAIFRCPKERWQKIEQVHRGILNQLIKPDDSILDAGCGWGRLLDLLPAGWGGYYLGVDLSPDFIAAARPRAVHQRREFYRADLCELEGVLEADTFDWAILISIRPMIKRHLGDEYWAKVEAEMRRVARKLLYLEYDEKDTGSVE